MLGSSGLQAGPDLHVWHVFLVTTLPNQTRGRRIKAGADIDLPQFVERGGVERRHVGGMTVRGLCRGVAAFGIQRLD
jgi:hypothetical protein